MDPNIEARLKGIEEKLDKTYNLVERVRRIQKQGQAFRIFYWTLIILATFGAFYYIQPYIDQLLEAYTGIQNTQEQLKTSIPSINNVNDLIKQFTGIQE